MRRASLVLVLTVAGGLALAVGSQARVSQAALKCGPGYVRGSVRVPERKHGRVVRRHHKIVYLRVQRCVKVRKATAPTTTPQPIPGAPQPVPGASGNPVTTPAATTTPPPAPPTKPSPCSTPIPGNTLQLGQATYTVAGEDTFTKDAPVGSFAQGSVPDASWLSPIYTGDYGMGWSAYPDGWPASYTGTNVAYQPSTVVSVHDGVLDFYLHDDANGNPVGADLSPWPGGNEYQTYGAYSFCEKVTSPAQLADFYQASLLWPQNSTDGECAESDFPESYASSNGGSLASGGVYAFAHYGAWTAQSGCPSTTRTQGSWHTSIDLSQWHVFTQEWGPGYRSYYIDGQQVYTTTTQVWSQPERWQLQMEPSPSSQLQKTGGTGHVYISWVWIGTRG